MSTKTPTKPFAALVFAAGLAITGCGNSTDDTSEASPEASEPEVTVTESETVEEQPSQDNGLSTEEADDDSTSTQNNAAPEDDSSAQDEDQDMDFLTSDLDYADALVVDWGEGDESAMHDFAGQQTVDALKYYCMPGGSS